MKNLNSDFDSSNFDETFPGNGCFSLIFVFASFKVLTKVVVNAVESSEDFIEIFEDKLFMMI